MRRRQFAPAVIATMVALGPATAAIPAGAGLSRSSQATIPVAPPTANRPLLTAIQDGPSGSPADDAIFGRHVLAAGARFVRLAVHWRFVAPGGSTKPAGFDARNSGDPKYVWTYVDRAVRLAAEHRLAPILYVYTAPQWAESGPKQRPTDGPVNPSVSELADFATAAATRYGGSFGGLPRVRYWQIWNEPNLSVYLMPQSDGARAVSPTRYRDMVNAFARAVHAVRADNVVIAGGLAPFGGSSNDPSGGTVPNQERIHPLEFMRQMLCMSKGAKPKATCKERSELDVWAHHPYTYGGPTHSAFHPDDVSLGDMAQMRTLIDAAKAVGHIQSRQKVGFWVTEFSYDSKPADPKGLPLALHARWVSEALYRMWSNGVSLVTWFLLRDQPFPDQMFQSGLYTRGSSGIASDKPKLALTAFRFPFVAFREKDRSISYWGRTPAGLRNAVIVEQKSGARWRRVAVPAVNRYGIFSGSIAKAPGRGTLRARLTNGSDVSVPFSLRVTPDFRFCPWGSFC